MANIPIVNSGSSSVSVVYHLHLPKGVVWEFDSLRDRTIPTNKMTPSWQFSGGIVIPVDLITAARLHMIRPGDDSGLSDEQWAWIRLIGLTGENT